MIFLSPWIVIIVIVTYKPKPIDISSAMNDLFAILDSMW